MTRRDLPSAVEQFLRTHIRTVLQLEVLLLLHRTPERWWTADAIDRELRSSIESVRRHLHELHASKLIELQAGAEPQFRLALAREGDAAIVLELANLSKTHFHALVERIYTRRDLQDFADAFTFKKGKGDDG